jgi:hypothetical protein
MHRYEIEDIGGEVGSGVFMSAFIEEHCIDPVASPWAISTLSADCREARPA